MLKGIAASQGIAIAKVYKLVQPVLDIQKKDANAEEELSKLDAAFTKTVNDIEKIKTVASKSLKEEELAKSEYDTLFSINADKIRLE